jgi:hypothetical protein
MRKNHATGLSDNIRITVFDRDGNAREVVILRNQIKNAWKNAIRDAIKGAVTDLEIKYMAWGSSSTANNSSQTTLVAEFGRKQITEQADGSTGVEISTTYMSPGEGVEHTIEEIGWFAGSTATSTANTGILVARVLYHRVKTALESIQVERTDMISEVV